MFFLCASSIFIVTSLFIDRNEKSSKPVFFIVLLGIVFFNVIYFSATRSLESSGDTWKYVFTYNQLDSMFTAREDGLEIYGNHELLFWPLAALIKEIGFNYRAWLILMPVLTMLPLLLSYRLISSELRLKNYLLVFTGLYFSYYLVFICAMRQSFSEGFVFLSFALAVKEKHRLSLLLMGVAFLFHTSSVIFFPILTLVLLRVRLSVKHVIMLFAFSLVFGSLLMDKFGWLVDMFNNTSVISKYDNYTNNGQVGEFDNILELKQFWMLMLASIAFVFVYGTHHKLSWYIIGVVSIILIFIDAPVISGRMLNYLALAFPIISYYFIDRLLFIKYKSLVFAILFSVIGFLVLSSHSAIITLTI